MGLRRMKDAMWKVDPEAGQAFRDSTLADHPVLFEQEADLARLQDMLREKFVSRWFTIEQAEQFTLLETAFRDNGHLKPGLKAAEAVGCARGSEACGEACWFVYSRDTDAVHLMAWVPAINQAVRWVSEHTFDDHEEPAPVTRASPFDSRRAADSSERRWGGSD